MADRLSRFAARLARFDREALIRLKDGAAWGRLPWDVLVRIDSGIDADVAGDTVISATSLQRRPDAQWRGSLPPARVQVVESVPAAAIRSAAQAAADTLRQMQGGPVGERRIRDALLDHVVISGESDADGTKFAVSQRLVQAIVRMSLLTEANVDVLVAGPWMGLGTSLGSVWNRTSSPLTVRPLR